MEKYIVSDYEFNSLVSRMKGITNQLNNDIADGNIDLIEEDKYLLNDIAAIINKVGSAGALVDEETHNLIVSQVKAYESDIDVEDWFRKLKDYTIEDALKSFGINI